MNSAMVSLNRFWMSSMLPMFAICNSSRIFSRRAFSSGVRFFLAMCNTSCLLLLFYTSQKVYTNYGIVSQDVPDGERPAIHTQLFFKLGASFGAHPFDLKINDPFDCSILFSISIKQILHLLCGITSLKHNINLCLQQILRQHGTLFLM